MQGISRASSSSDHDHHQQAAPRCNFTTSLINKNSAAAFTASSSSSKFSEPTKTASATGNIGMFISESFNNNNKAPTNCSGERLKQAEESLRTVMYLGRL
ncbi:hypothetical protein FNV43_RR13514 [Rhamnella rubrinervis]|uniref:Uncharacterized protein n=1 Tax=Rhamnella rubrinervis TaxID=2594499 RepID=A0A8K0MEC9_9ROSA|nr:hypothetical protein FNV43_RR13514 [Rhamnella rubrinervis]